jgi:hypothetical protein
MYLLAANITDAKQQRALLLYVAGPAVHKIFNTLTDTGTDYKTAVEKLDSYFQPQKNVIYESRHDLALTNRLIVSLHVFDS